MTSLQLSPQAAATELLRRRAGRASLIGFTEYISPHYVAEPFHRLVGEYLDAVIAGTIKRLMIWAPPQHGKSLLASVHLPAKWIGARPNDPVILTSYAASLAEGFSRQARDIVESADFRTLYGDLGPSDVVPVETRQDSRSVHEWRLRTPYRGGLLAVGVDGPVTGHGGLLGIIDDPFENWRKAQSARIRKLTWDWYRMTFYPRMWENAAIVLMMTRWNEDDLAGQILKEGMDEWTVLRLPAIAESQKDRDANNRHLHLPIGEADHLGRKAGEPLAPKRFSLRALNNFKIVLGSMGFSAEYQGVPRPAEGSRIKRAWLPITRDKPPAGAKRCRYWDKAGTEGGGKYTAGVLVCKHEGMFYVEDVVRGQWSAGKREKIIKATAQADREKYGSVRTYIEQEPGSGGKESAEATIKNLAGFSIQADRPTGDKDVRLDPFAVQAEARFVKVVSGPWNSDFVEEMIAIPNGAFRDQADAVAGAFNMLTAPGGRSAVWD
jgi:predicted phage terminase large subunit-like protein